MHLSLKGSMDRQPLTDRLGDRLLAEYGGAAAAYSLRALNGNGDNVVRVRRASDNDEKDFTAEQIELGEMVNWVNSQTVPPLDIGVETEDGRIPVPEGGTSIGTPAAAYSLRNLSTTYTGNVVDVRRSSDDAVESFTAEEVSDGTLEAWVFNDDADIIRFANAGRSGSPAADKRMYFDGGGTQEVDISDVTLSGDFFIEFSCVLEEFGAETARIFNNTGASQRLYFNSNTELTLTLGGTSSLTPNENFEFGVSYDIRIERTSSTLSFYVNGVLQDDTTSVSTNDLVITVIGDGVGRFKGIISDLNFNDQASYNGYGNTNADWEDQIGSNDGTVNGSPELFTGQGFDGTVSKWYDQSGNNNHAVQTTAANQPKIVDAGVLVTGGVEFDEVNDYLSFSTSFSISTDFAIFGTIVSSDFSRGGRIFHESGNDNIRVRNSTYDFRYRSGGVNYDFGTGTSFTNNNQSLFSFLNESDEHSLFVNGALKGQQTIIDNLLMSSISDQSGGITLGGAISELIIYDSDQSDNRTAIEANIGETYGITGIPAYDNTVDGFVETWYDQSGNGNDATQSVAASQPKIVDAGSLVTNNNGKAAILGDATDDILNFSSEVDFGTNDFFVSTVVDAGSGAVCGSPSPNWLLLLATNTIQVRSTNTNTIYIITPNTNFTAGESYLVSLSRVGDNLTAFVDGVAQTDVEVVTSTDTFGVDRFLQRGINGNPYDETLSEVIIYDSDQSSNRTAIETNINDHYNIY